MTSPPVDHRLARVRAIARVLDTAIGVPGTKFRFGLDPLLGLIPGVGDLTGAALSAYVVLTAVQMGAPKHVIVRMIGNVAIDSLVGSVPVLGDLFDAAFKSNRRNINLIEEFAGRAAVVQSPADRRRSRLYLALAIALLLLVVVGGIALAVWLMKQVMSLFTA